MRRFSYLLILSLAVVTMSQKARAASTTGLADWCFSENGNQGTCNGNAPSSYDPLVNISGFDTTLEPSTNNLGSAVITLTPGQTNFVAIYADYDLDYAAYLGEQDQAKTGGAQPGNWSYELNCPPSGECSTTSTFDTFNDFSAFNNSTPLNNMNTVATGATSNPGPPCCDVLWALGINGLVVPASGSGTVTFTVSTTRPTSGFYLQQTDIDAGDSIYLSAVVNIGGMTSVPEPSYLWAVGAFALLFIWRRRKLALTGK